MGTKLHVFKNHKLNSNYVTKGGKQLNFLNGKLHTDNEEDIKELEAEVKSGNPHIYVDENEKTVDSDEVTPLQIIEKRMREKILAEMAAAKAANPDMGSTTQNGKLEGIANSSNILGAADSDSTNPGAVDPNAPPPMIPSDTNTQVPITVAEKLALLSAKK